MSHLASADADRDEQRHARRSVRRRALLGVGVVTVAALVAGGAWFLRAPDRAFEAGYGIKMERAVGVRVWTVLEHGQSAQPGVIDIDSIEPHLTRDGAAAEVEYAICHLDAEAVAAHGVSGSGYGTRDPGIRRYCTRVVPAEGASMRLGTEPGEELLVAVTTTRPGRTVVRSHRIEFSEGWRHGVADIHATVDITAR